MDPSFDFSWTVLFLWFAFIYRMGFAVRYTGVTLGKNMQEKKG
jgi:hypothetical protein